MNTKGLLGVVVLLVGVLTAAAQEKAISLADLDGYFQQAEKGSFNSPWSVRTVVEVGETSRGTWEDYSRWSYSVVPPDRSHLVYLGDRTLEFIHIGPLSYSKAEDRTWSRSDDTIKGSLVSPTTVRRFGDGEISYTQSRTGDILVVKVVSKPSADADPLDLRIQTYVFYFSDVEDISRRRGMLTGEESIIHDGTKWVRTTNIYTFNSSIRIEAPVEKVASQLEPIPETVFREAPKNPPTDEPLVILSKPRPAYTDEARSNGVQGTVILNVTFEADGTIGAIEVVKGLAQGLTEMTVDAARKIAFTPARRNGIPVSYTRQLQYSFSIY